jgi:hypothetical protein
VTLPCRSGGLVARLGSAASCSRWYRCVAESATCTSSLWHRTVADPHECRGRDQPRWMANFKEGQTNSWLCEGLQQGLRRSNDGVTAHHRAASDLASGQRTAEREQQKQKS